MQNDTHPEDERQASIERRLATIMMADVAGYSRMMGENEERTVKTLRGHREIFDAILRLHRGRIFNTAGDAILAEFPSAVEAVRCATELQAALRTRNEQLPPEERMWFRIGINLGDIIVQGTDLLGDGVNVAARIQTIAEPGGICISGSVYDQIQNKLTLRFNLLGERSFKNIAQPIRTFSISESNNAVIPPPLPSRRSKRRFFVGLAAVFALIAVTAGGYWIYSDYKIRSADEKKAAEARQRQETLEAEARKRQAKLEADAQAARAALEQTEAEKKRLEQELKRTEAERLSAESAARQMAADKAKLEEKMKGKPPEPQSDATTQRPAHTEMRGDGVNRFNGNYSGRFCMKEASGQLCWTVNLKAENGTLSATWPSRASGKTAHAKGTISEEGSVLMTVSAWDPSGRPAEAALTGTCSGALVSLTGAWKNGPAITGNFERQAEAKVTEKFSRDVKQDNGLNRFDGNYSGRFCNSESGGMKCWTVVLKVEQGAISATWPSRVSGKISSAKGTISKDASVVITLSAWDPSGRPAEGKVTGTLNNGIISLSGSWGGVSPVNGTFKLNP